MLDQVPILTVYRYKIFRLDQVEHGLEFVLAGVPGDVDLAGCLVVDFCAAAIKMIDQVRDRPFIAGDELGGKDDGVARFNADLLVVVHGDARERAQGFTLTAGGQNQDLFRWHVTHLAQVDQDVVRNGEIAKLPRDGDVTDHAAARDHHFAPGFDRGINDLLDAVDVRGEGGYQDLAGTAWQEIVEGVANRPLGEGLAGVLNVGGIGEQ